MAFVAMRNLFVDHVFWRLGWSVYYSVVILLLSFCGRYISALLQIFLPEI